MTTIPILSKVAIPDCAMHHQASPILKGRRGHTENGCDGRIGHRRDEPGIVKGTGIFGPVKRRNHRDVDRSGLDRFQYHSIEMLGPGRIEPVVPWNIQNTEERGLREIFGWVAECCCQRARISGLELMRGHGECDTERAGRSRG